VPQSRQPERRLGLLFLFLQGGKLKRLCSMLKKWNSIREEKEGCIAAFADAATIAKRATDNASLALL
jgi:hypothetical protein